MKFLVLHSLLLILIISMRLSAQGVQQDQEPFRVEVDAVNLLVTVTDSKTGEFVRGLNAEDFRIIEDGRLQRITHFSKQTNMPLTIALCIDTSASVKLKLEFEKEAASEFLFTVMQPHDKALLLEFDSGVTLLHDFTHNPNDLVREIRRLRAGGGTSLYDALYLVSEQKLLDEEGRKTIVILTDGADVTSRRSFEEAMRMVYQAEAATYAISTTRFGANFDRSGDNVLKQITESTGGNLFFPVSTRELNVAFEKVSQELRNQYSLTYVPNNTAKDGSFRNVRVEVSRSNTNVRHRKGYYAPVDSPERRLTETR
jgi:Ca-activated chloride channel homolog